MRFTDTHCHIHEADYPLDREAVVALATQHGVDRLICVGTDLTSSRDAIIFAQYHPNIWASIGIHPHEANKNANAKQELHRLLEAETAGRETVRLAKDILPSRQREARPDLTLAAEQMALASLTVSPQQRTPLATAINKVVAIGECGLDYFYQHSPKEAQISLLRTHIELALEADLPLIFHVRDAFDDFWPIFDSYPSLRGVLHSFTDSKENLAQALARNLYIGINGISTFTKSDEQNAMYAAIPPERMLLETDAPFLTPVPKRGTINQPAFVTLVAQHIADLQHTSLTELSERTNQNATELFNLK
ncbi:MAG TPA: TatD family hydrolase [Candidatus Saccharimonadales bacterium]|jgi:TatD DNase family protein|nr:TatD family hydrolase [Candidatus Saccharimonadales bacterium]